MVPGPFSHTESTNTGPSPTSQGLSPGSPPFVSQHPAQEVLANGQKDTEQGVDVVTGRSLSCPCQSLHRAQNKPRLGWAWGAGGALLDNARG